MQVDDEFMSLYQEAKAITGESMDEVLKRALKDYIKKNSPKEREQRREARREKKKAVVVPTTDKDKSRSIPAANRDRVTLRDGHRCTFVSEDAVRCPATSATETLEVDHIVLFSQGGSHEVENLRLRCRAHNLLGAEQVLGREYMERFY